MFAAVLGLAHSRATNELQKLDLHDQAATEELIRSFKPDGKPIHECQNQADPCLSVLIHAAAERRPDGQ